jgi:dihydrofolate synthase/folylpolyglutamate synthase
MNYSQTLEYLYSQLPMFHRIGAAAYKADLGNTNSLIEILGHPEQKFLSVHIAGTNGKGSVSHMIASVLQEAGYKTGLYTSPHLKDFRERIRINGKKIPKNYVTRFVALNKGPFDNIKPSFFEYTAVMAFRYFADEKVDIAVMETGMGGRLDSTNVIKPLLSVITNISKDHMAFLGKTLPEIATEKAGIIKPGIPIIIGETQPETAFLFRTKAYENNSPIQFADQRYNAVKIAKRGRSTQMKWNIDLDGKPLLEGLKCPLEGNYQARNLPVVFSVVEALKKQGFSISEAILRKGIERVVRNTGLMGRWQKIGVRPTIICDVGHNEAGIRSIIEQLGEEKFNELHFVFGMVSDKDAGAILNLLPSKATYYFCKPDIPRGRDAGDLREEAKSLGLKGKIYGSVKEAFEAAKAKSGPDDLIFVGGSTFVVAEVI